MIGRRTLLICIFVVAFCTDASAQPSDPMPSSNDGATKKSITDFVARVTTQGSREITTAMSSLRCSAQGRVRA
jgi:hypothetical protein